MSVLPRLFYGFDTIPVKISAAFCGANGKQIPKYLHGNAKSPIVVQTALYTNRVELTLPDFETDYTLKQLRYHGIGIKIDKSADKTESLRNGTTTVQWKKSLFAI